MASPVCAGKVALVADRMSVLTGEDASAVDSLIKAVLAHGSNRWYGLGLALGLEPALIESVTHTKPDHADKLRALIEKKRQEVGSEKLGEELLKACGNVPHPIRGVVEETLKESSQQPN